jgi:ferredoxin-NADP reductase
MESRMNANIRESDGLGKIHSHQASLIVLLSVILLYNIPIMFERRVREVRFHTPDLFEISLERGGYSFEAGECAVLFNGAGDSRPYSVASAPQADDLRFLLRRIPGGALSSWLAQRRPGDSVRLSPPFGAFRPACGGRPLVLVATGVGVSPFLSLLRSLGGPPASAAMDSGDAVPPQSIYCLYGVRAASEAVELALLQQKTVLQLAVSRDAQTEHFPGRVTGLLETLRLPADADYYLCGCDAMIDEVFGILHRRGIPASRIFTEVFFNSLG